MEDLTVLFQVLLGAGIGSIIWLCYNAYLRRNNLSNENRIGNFSIKFHKFFWFIVIPTWTLTGTIDYLVYWSDLNYFPMTLFMTMEFIYCVLMVVSFVGFFKFKKYSWYTTLSFLSLMLALEALMLVYLSSIGAYEVSDIGGLLGKITINVPSFIYYYKRRPLFFDNVNKTNTKIEDSIMFCRFCGKAIPSDSVYCPSCGNKIQ